MDVITLAMAKKYTNDTAIQFGGLKGAPCKIQSIVEGDGYNTVTFEYKNDEGATQTRTMRVINGTDAPVISDISIDANNHLTITLDDGTTYDCGRISAVAELKEPLKATVEIGTVTNGKTYPTGTDIETIIRDMLIKYEAPAVSLAITPSTRLYDIVTDSITTILEKATVTKKTNPVTAVSFYVDSTLLNTITTGVASGGTFSYQYNPETPINRDVVFKATATDGKQTTTSSISVKFVAKSYYGICDASVSDPDETTIKSGTSNLKDTRTLNYTGITTSWGKVFYAYPKSFGALTYIKDEVNNVNYFDSFQRSETTVDGIDYYCYTLIEATASTNGQITFK